ncbi:MAG: response regulator transcription factor [Anaerolineales bacterium]
MDSEKIRVLIVDDNPRVRENLAAVLVLAGQSTGVRIELAGQAEDGREGIELARALQPDVVLMDLEMPLLDGFEATRQIKALVPAPRVVILSVHTGTGEREYARKAGADGFVVKGAPCQILLLAILEKDGSTHPNDFTKGEKP